MMHPETGQPVSFSLWAKNWAEIKEQSDHRSAQSSASYRRSGCSPAEPYPPHECQDSTIPAYPPFAKGTSLLCRRGDISTLH
jgi:hypothetical protein